MIKSTGKTKIIWVLLPIFGSLAFLCLYFIAALFYPGGSQVDKYAKGFSWINNYWCNLLDENAMNGKHNSGRPAALTAMLVLCVTLSFFWYQTPRYYNWGKFNKVVVQLTGTSAAAVAMFLFAGWHDLIINIAGALGSIALISTLIGFYKSKCYRLFLFGIANLLLIVLNNYVYYSKGLIIYLPVIQKISFSSFLIWVCCISIDIYRHENVKSFHMPTA